MKMWALWKEKKMRCEQHSVEREGVLLAKFSLWMQGSEQRSGVTLLSQGGRKDGLHKEEDAELAGMSGTGARAEWRHPPPGSSGFWKTDEAEEDDSRSTHRLRRRPPVDASLSTCAEGGGEGKSEAQRMKGRRMGERVTTRREAGSYQD